RRMAAQSLKKLHSPRLNPLPYFLQARRRVGEPAGCASHSKHALKQDRPLVLIRYSPFGRLACLLDQPLGSAIGFLQEQQAYPIAAQPLLPLRIIEDLGVIADDGRIEHMHAAIDERALSRPQSPNQVIPVALGMENPTLD